MGNKWDIRFLDLAKFISSWSKDPSTKTGAVITRSDNSIVSLGFNGFPRNLLDTPELYADREKKYSRIVHCEANALLFARESVKDYTLYTWPFASCDRCAVQMLQAGISRFVYPELPADKADRWKVSLDKTRGYYAEAGVEYVEIRY